MVEQTSKLLRVTGFAESANCLSYIQKKRRRPGLGGNEAGQISNY